MTRELSERLNRAAIKACSMRKVTDTDPGIAIVYSETGLAQHHPAHDAQAARLAIQNAVLNAGMSAADEGDSDALFNGNNQQCFRAHLAVHNLNWARRQNGLEDVGTFYFVFPKGTKDVEYVKDAVIFNSL